MTNHLGYSSPSDPTGSTSGNCIRYSPGGTVGASGWVGHGEEALSAHGRHSQYAACPGELNTNVQSALGFKPGPGGDIPVESVKALGTITHYNNPVYAEDTYYRGTLEVRTALVDGDGNPATFDFPWFMHETPNTPVDQDDYVKISVQSPETVVYIPDGDGGRKPYRMVVAGFAANAAACDAGNYTNEWWTVENQQTSAVLCAQLTQVRSLEILKDVVLPDGFVGEIPAFGFDSSTTMDNLDGVDSFWSNDFSLKPSVDAPGTTGAQDVLVPNQTVTVKEKAVDGWELFDVSCNGEGAVADRDNGQIMFRGKEVGSADDLAATCSFLNRPKVAPLTIEKAVSDLEYTQDWDWNITKTVDPADTLDHPAHSGTTFSYTVTVTPKEGAKHSGRYTSTIDIANPNVFPIKGVALHDENCEIDAADKTFDLGANESKTVTLACHADEIAEGTNEAWVHWEDPYGIEGVASAAADFNFDDALVKEGAHAEVMVSDTFKEFAEKYPDAKLHAADGAMVFTYDVKHIAPAGECKHIENTASLSSGHEASVEVQVCAGKLSLVKKADKTKDAVAGDHIKYTFVATNEGKVKLTGVSIMDDVASFTGSGKLSALTCDQEMPATLDAGQSLTCHATYEVTKDDVKAGKIHNVAHARSDQTDPVMADELVRTKMKKKPGLPRTGADGEGLPVLLLALPTLGAGLIAAARRK